MGEVYRARDTRLNRDVALKLLPDAFAADADRVARFEREAHVLASLNHPHIAAVYGLEDAPATTSTTSPAGHARVALVMELVDGNDLSEKLKGLRPEGSGIPLDEALPIAKQIAEALEAAHEQGIVHRDLKPANIKVRADGTVKVLDFGLAKALDPGAGAAGAALSMSPTLSVHATAAGIILGTAAYMSPEQAAGRPVDRRTDLWSFGAVVMEMLTGRPVFAGQSVSEVLASVLKTEPDWTALPAATPAPLERLLRRCLEKDRRRRLDSAAAARLEIEEAANPATLTNPAAQIPTNPKSRISNPIVGAAVIAGAALLLWAPWRADRTVDRPLVRLDVDLGADVSLPIPGQAGTSVAISPDGTRLVYVSGTPPKLFIRRLDQAKAVELPGTQGATAAMFSPDGQWIAFATVGGRASKISIEGGAVVPIAAMAARDSAWGDDGAEFFTWDLRRMPGGGGAPEPLAQAETGGLALGEAQLLPGGKAILFSADYPGPVDRTTIFAVTLADRRKKMVMRGGASPRFLVTRAGGGHLIYVNRATLFGIPFDLDALETRGTAVPLLEDVAHETLVGEGQFDVSRTGTLVYRKSTGSQALEKTLQWLDASGRREALRARPALVQDISLSPDGRLIALTIDDGANTDLWIYDPQRDAMTRATFGGKAYRNPLWSPDGRYIVFSDVGNGLVAVRADGATQPQPLTQRTFYQTPSSFTLDGRRLAYGETRGNGIWTIAIEERDGQLKAGAPELFVKSGSNEALPAFSPDGRWIAYQSDESGATEVYVRPFPPPASGQGGRRQVSSGGGRRPHWSRSGHDLLYESADQILAAAYAVKGDTFVAEKPRVWIPKLGAASSANGVPWDLAPDGRRVLVVTRPAPVDAAVPEHEIVIVQNFFDELRRRVK